MIIKNKTIKIGDHVAFNFQYNSESKPEIEVGEVVYVSENQVSVIFLYGYKSLSEDLKKEQIVAIVDKTLKTPRTMLGSFSGHFISLT